MHRFEGYLISLGYIKHILDCSDMKYKTELKPLSALASYSHTLDYRYIHESDTNLLTKIDKGEVVGEGITREDQKRAIIFGLHEYNHPPTLISPRPHCLSDTGYINNDAEMSGILTKYTDEEVFNTINSKW